MKGKQADILFTDEDVRKDHDKPQKAKWLIVAGIILAAIMCAVFLIDIDEEYKIIYNVDGKEYKTVNVNDGDKIVLIAPPVKEGYTFSGWSGSPDVMPAKDVVVNGTFTVNRYKVTYQLEGEVFETDSVAFGEKLDLKEVPAKQSYTFSGWSGLPDVMPAKDVTLIGTYQKQSSGQNDRKKTTSDISAGGANGGRSGNVVGGKDLDVNLTAKMTIRGDFGNGENRKLQLGGNYTVVQDRVNELYRIGQLQW